MELSLFGDIAFSLTKWYACYAVPGFEIHESYEKLWILAFNKEQSVDCHFLSTFL